jgi:23S rRNA pseudouridine1911/1915/1917 synthase
VKRAFVVRPEEAGERLDVTLARHAGVSRAQAQRLLAEGFAVVDGVARAKHYQVRPGERVEVEEPPAGETGLVAEEVPFTVVYEDEWLLVVDKPAGVVVHPAPGHEHGTLAQGLLAHGAAGGHERRPGIVHRLDRDTSGLLIVARRPDAYRRLVALLAARRVARTYHALLVGDLPQDEGTIDAPIGRHLRDRTRMSLLSAAPRRAVTHFAVLERLRRAAAGSGEGPVAPPAGGGRGRPATSGRGGQERFTYVEVRLETGRTHQIRVHFAALGYPVAGDTVYGRGRRPAGLARQFLHASRLRFPHPRDGRELEFEAPLPEDLTVFLASLRHV